MKTLQKLASEALLVQDACNLSGVAISFVNVIDEIRTITPRNECWQRHPIIQLWVDKIASLAGTQFEWDSLAAYRVVEDIAK